MEVIRRGPGGLTEEFDAILLERPGLLQTIQRNSYDLFAKGKNLGLSSNLTSIRHVHHHELAMILLLLYLTITNNEAIKKYTAHYDIMLIAIVMRGH